MPRSKRLLSDARSNVLVYLTGHGGDEFLKFQDQARIFALPTGLLSGDCTGCIGMYRRRRLRAPQVEISSMDIADALAQMAEKHRYREARPQRAFGRLFPLLRCQPASGAVHGGHVPGRDAGQALLRPRCVMAAPNAHATLLRATEV